MKTVNENKDNNIDVTLNSVWKWTARDALWSIPKPDLSPDIRCLDFIQMYFSISFEIPLLLEQLSRAKLTINVLEQTSIQISNTTTTIYWAVFHMLDYEFANIFIATDCFYNQLTYSFYFQYSAETTGIYVNCLYSAHILVNAILFV